MIFVESNHQEIHLESKIIPRQLNELNSDVPSTSKVDDHSKESHNHQHSDASHSAIGIFFSWLFYQLNFLLGVTLILGFVFMLIVDHCSSRLFHHHGTQGCSSSSSWKTLFARFVFISSRLIRFSDYHQTQSHMDGNIRSGCSRSSRWHCSRCSISNQSIQY